MANIMNQSILHVKREGKYAFILWNNYGMKASLALFFTILMSQIQNYYECTHFTSYLEEKL